jgi:hypothetical protein
MWMWKLPERTLLKSFVKTNVAPLKMKRSSLALFLLTILCVLPFILFYLNAAITIKEIQTDILYSFFVNGFDNIEIEQLSPADFISDININLNSYIYDLLTESEMNAKVNAVAGGFGFHVINQLPDDYQRLYHHTSNSLINQSGFNFSFFMDDYVPYSESELNAIAGGYAMPHYYHDDNHGGFFRNYHGDRSKKRSPRYDSI